VCLIVSHDAGGAEILANYVAQNKQQLFQFVLAGPALLIFQRTLGDISVSELDLALVCADWCLCGTSWQSDLEWQAIDKAQRLDKKVIAFIDHWVNYSDRFIRNNVQHLPDEIWVGDEYAEKEARRCFMHTPIEVVENSYLINIKKQIDALSMSIKTNGISENCLLFVSENISGHALLKYGDKNYFGYTEFDALEFLLQYLDCISIGLTSVVIRPHPADAKGKYDAYLKHKSIHISVSQEASLLKDILKVNIVAGCQSMALEVALIAGKTVFSCMPFGLVCHLPHKGIHILSEKIV